MTVVKTIFSQIQLCIGYFATSWDQVQGYRAWPYFCPLPWGSCPLVCPLSLSLEDSGNEAYIRRKGWFMERLQWNPPTKKANCRHESNRVWWVLCVRLPGCPVLRHCRQGWATASPWWTYGLPQVESEVTGWPANILQEQELWHCMASHWVGHRCSCTQQCVQKGSCHHKAMSWTTSFVCTGAQADWWTNVPHPFSQFTDAWSEGWPRSAAWKAP